MIKVVPVILLSLLLLSCSNTAKDSATASDNIETKSIVPADTSGISVDDLFKIESYLTESVNDTSKVQIIDYDCAIFVDPSNEQIEAMKKEYDEDTFYTVADDAMWYYSQATDSLELSKIKIVNTRRDYLKLQGVNNEWTLALRKKGAPGWMVIYFKRIKDPEIISSIDVTTKQIENYFKK